MQEIKLRTATLEDIEALEISEQGIIQYERPFAPQLKHDPIHYYAIEDLIQNKDACFVIAELNDRPIGCGYGIIQKSKPTKKERHHAYLGFMYVIPKQRGKGVNAMVIQYLIDWANSKGLTEIVLEVYSENKSAVKAYKKIGFQPGLVKMRLNTEELVEGKLKVRALE